jgi:hypothetical protein
MKNTTAAAPHLLNGYDGPAGTAQVADVLGQPGHTGGPTVSSAILILLFPKSMYLNPYQRIFFPSALKDLPAYHLFHFNSGGLPLEIKG